MFEFMVPPVTPDELPKVRAAELLEALTDGRLTIRYEPGAEKPDDPGSRGCLFIGKLALSEDDDDLAELLLDDRDGPLPAQIGIECRRIARLYLDIAEAIERKDRRRVEGMNA